jgi:hypothetical protein
MVLLRPNRYSDRLKMTTCWTYKLLSMEFSFWLLLIITSYHIDLITWSGQHKITLKMLSSYSLIFKMKYLILKDTLLAMHLHLTLLEYYLDELMTTLWISHSPLQEQMMLLMLKMEFTLLTLLTRVISLSKLLSAMILTATNAAPK